MTTKETLSAEVGSLIDFGNAIIRGMEAHLEVDGFQFSQFRIRTLNLGRRLGDVGLDWKQIFDQYSPVAGRVSKMVGVLVGAKHLIENDQLTRIENLVINEAFGNLLEQAEHLLENGYYLAAGVLGRAVLEEHLRKLCDRAQCNLMKPTPMLNDYNQALYSSQKIDKTTMMHLTFLIGVGNEAAHNLPTLTREKVDKLLPDVRDFVAKNPLP